MLAKVIDWISQHHAAIMLTLGALTALARLLAKNHAEAVKVKLPRLYAVCQFIAAIAPDVVPAARAIANAWRGAR